MSNQNRDAEYTMGRSEEETQRLIEQSQLYDDVTRRFFPQKRYRKRHESP